VGKGQRSLESVVVNSSLSSFKDIYQGKRVLVTGDTGFKGSWLSLWLHELGADVVGYALPPERNEDHFKVIGLDKVIHHIDGDIRDFPLLAKVFNDFQPDFLFHLAAQTLVNYSYREPKLTFDTNVSGSVNILEMVRSTESLHSVIYVTSDKCYKNKEWIWGYRESDELGGHDPYSASKAAAEIIFSAYMDSFLGGRAGLGAASVRAGNVIGGGDWALDRIVPDCIKALRSGKPIVVRNPTSTRPWQHVLDPLSGYLLLAAKMYHHPDKYSGAWNFGPVDASVRTVKELAERIVEFWGEGEIQVDIHPNAPHEATFLHLNCDKAHRILDWYPRYDFDHAVDKTAYWYKEVTSGRPALQISKQQLKNYVEGSID
jgi:CDP-glucose 4,6-dehydratase